MRICKISFCKDGRKILNKDFLMEVTPIFF